MIVNEMIEFCLRKKEKIILMKFDFYKVYDFILWSFLVWMFIKMNFFEKWRVWMKKCVEIVRILVLVNGVFLKFFNM